MKKISLLLIFCFLFQGCALSGLSIGIVKDDSRKDKESVKNKSCNFEEVLSQKAVDMRKFYSNRFLLAGSIMDVGLSAYYFITFNPKGFVLFATGVYAFYSLIFLGMASESIKDEASAIYLAGWHQDYGTECKEEHFGFSFQNEDQLIQSEKLFLKAILNYPHDYDISQDQNFSTFQKDFLRNYKIQTYSKGNYFYHYIHYPGGKAKFEEDFGKYLYKP
ncbi:MAG: hypothetical protein IPH52_02450 [Leptospiraceae bacterium]|nr:hypothetical protein [Leptospiraceae bacterium]